MFVLFNRNGKVLVELLEESDLYIVGDYILYIINDDVNRLNTHIDQFVMVENKHRIKIKEIVNDNIKKAQEKYVNN